MSGPDTFWARRIAPLLRPQFMRYLAVGAANTGFAILVYWAMLWAGLAVPLAVRSLLAHLCATEPVAIIIDDLQWLDQWLRRSDRLLSLPFSSS